MSNASINSRNKNLTILESFWLENEDFEEAKMISKQVNNEVSHDQSYLNCLALFGFKRWLEERVNQLPIITENCSVYQPDYANLIDTVCNLRVGEFNLCIICLLYTSPSPRDS